MNHLLITVAICVSASPPIDERPGFARPIKTLALSDAVYVANSATGKITILNSSCSKILAEASVGRSLGDIAVATADISVATDPASRELVFLSTTEQTAPTVIGKVKLAGADRVAVSLTSDVCAVTSVWDQSVTIVKIATAEPVQTVKLDFEPLAIVALTMNRFFIADAFGGQIAIVEENGNLTPLTPLDAHNIRGLLVVGDEILISHQRLNQIARTEFADVHWGTLMQNIITRLPLASLTAANLRPRTMAIGDVANGSAEPGAMVRLDDGRLAVTIRGTDELLISPIPDKRGRFRFAKGQRFGTGIRPVHVALTSDHTKLVVANQLADSLSVFTVGEQFESMTLQSTEQLSPTQIERGERAFVSAKLSHDGWLSCNSCHVDGHTPGLRADTLGDGSFGAPKLIPSLFGAGETGPWGWSGTFQSLDSQVAKSILTTMHGANDNNISADIAAYVQTLKPRTKPSLEGTAAGRRIFSSSGCNECHQSDQFTSDKVIDIGFEDESGLRQFNPPSLRGLRYRRAFFHDGRAKTIEQALQLHLKGLNKNLPKSERSSLKHYLNSL